MHDVIFSLAVDFDRIEPLILVESIRAFASRFSDSPIWLFTAKSNDEIPTELKSQYESFKADIFHLDIDPELAKFPFITHVFAAAKAEEMALGKSKNLVFLGVNTIIIQEPKEFMLEDGINLGYRPVHHKLIGSEFNEPIDSFWEIIFRECGVTEEMIFPMKTHVDGKSLRPYINSGYLIVKPERGFFEQWWKNYLKMYNNPELKEFYKKDDLYLIFVHQAVLSGTFLSYLSKDETLELPFEHNYPINLYHESLDKYKPKSINNLVTARYYLNKLRRPEDFEKIPFEEPFKGWLKARIVHTEDK